MVQKSFFSPYDSFGFYLHAGRPKIGKFRDGLRKSRKEFTIGRTPFTWPIKIVYLPETSAGVGFVPAVRVGYYTAVQVRASFLGLGRQPRSNASRRWSSAEGRETAVTNGLGLSYYPNSETRSLSAPLFELLIRTSAECDLPVRNVPVLVSSRQCQRIYRAICLIFV